MNHQQAWEYMKQRVQEELGFQKSFNIAMVGQPETVPYETGNVDVLLKIQSQMNMLEQFFIVDDVEHEEVCTEIEEPFFSAAKHPTRGIVATYGTPIFGLMDVYTAPVEVEEGKNVHVDVFSFADQKWDEEGVTYPKGEQLFDHWNRVKRLRGIKDWNEREKARKNKK